MGNSGYDWVAVDQEHGSISNHQLPDIFRALELGGTLPLVRLAQGQPKDCKQALDAGAGGIIIPDSSQEKPLEATVVSVGKGRVDQKGNLSPLTVKKGDKVLFSKFGGAEVSINDQDLMVLEERDILAIIG